MVIVDADAANELITGGWFGRIDGSRLLRWPAKNWKPNPYGSLEGSNPNGKPADVAARVVPRTLTIAPFTPFTQGVLAPGFRTHTLVTCAILVVPSLGLK